MKKIIFSIALTLFSINLFAHALWIETKALGFVDVKQNVKVFYGEYSAHTPEKITDWYSDVKDFELWLVSPSGQKTKLAVIPKEDYFMASFIPSTNGVYTLQISHSAKELGKGVLYQFNTSATVTVGNNDVVDMKHNQNPLKFSLTKPGLTKPVIINGIYNSTPSDKMDVVVFPPKGDEIKLKGENGTAQFVPKTSGKYMIEISRYDELKGQHYGKDYTGIWRCATYLIEIQ